MLRDESNHPTMHAPSPNSDDTGSTRTSYFPIQQFPNEILSHIFEVGTWLPDVRDDSFNRYTGEWLKPNRRSHPPQRKWLVKAIALVCSRWNQIVCWRGNYLTFTTVCLTLDETLLGQLPAFRSQLRESNGSDLDVILTCNSTVHLSEENKPSLSYEEEALRLFMHGISMLTQYINNVRSIYAELLHPDVVRLLMRMMSDVRPNSRLTQLRLRSAKLSDTDSGGVNKGYSTHFLRGTGKSRGSRLPYPSSMNSLTVLDLSGITPGSTIPVPDNLDHLSLCGLEASSPLVNWKHFNNLMRPLFALRSMQLDLCHFKPDSTSTICDEISLPHLRTLSLIGVCFDLLKAFNKRFRIPSLTTFNMFRVFVRSSVPSDLSGDEKEHSPDGIQAPHLLKSPPAPLGLGYVERPLRVERLLQVSGQLGIDQVICLLSLLDIRDIEDMIIRHSVYDISPAEKSTSRDEIDHQIVLPRLRSLEFYSGIADETSRLLAHLHATKLSFFEDNFYLPQHDEPVFSIQREKSLSRWRGIVSHEENWSAITKMTIDIPAFQPRSLQNAFASFPCLEHLSLFLDNGLDESRMDWSGMNWLCSLSPPGSDKRQDLIPFELQHLRLLDLLIFAEDLSLRTRGELIGGTREWSERIRAWRETQSLRPLERVRLLDYRYIGPKLVEMECIHYQISCRKSNSSK